MLCMAMTRHLIGDDSRLDRVVSNIKKARCYKFILKLILDNDES